MIKLATMTSVCPDWSLDRIIEAMQSYGYQGLEPRIGWNHQSGIETSLSAKERDHVRSRVEDAGLKICCVATGARLATQDTSELEQYIQEVNAAIDLAADLGAPYVRTFGGERSASPLVRVVAQLAGVYRQFMDRAAERGITVLIETHDSWCVSAQVRAVVEEVGHPNMGVLWDLLHPLRFLERPQETFANIGTYTRHLHAHNGRYDAEADHVKGVNLGEGDPMFDNAAPLKLLQEAGFDGYLSLEIIYKPGTPHDAEGTLRANAEAFRRIFA